MPYKAYDDELTGNFVADHWHGRYPLGRAYWMHFFLIVGVVTSLVFVILESAVENLSSLQTGSALIIFGFLFGIAAWVWAAVGVWRSASRHSERGGNGGWASIAKAVVLLGVIGTFGKISDSLESLIETASLAVNNDPLGKPASVSILGDTLVIDGPLSLGTAARVSESLSRTPNLKTISISSVGGRIAEAGLIAAEIKKRSLNTIVNGHCESACTFVLIAGTQRIASFGSSVGFHQPTYPGLRPSELAELRKESRAAYLAAGLPRDFVTKALQTTPEEMWYPPESELFEAGVYNAFDLRRVVHDNKISAAQVNRTSPIKIDDITDLESAKADGPTMTYNYRVSVSVEEFDLNLARTSLFQANSKELCSKPLIPQIISAGGVYRFIYLDPNGRKISDFQVDHC